MLRTIGNAVLLGCLLSLSPACGALSVLDHPGARLMVRLYDARNDLLLELANESHPDYQGLYSTERASASLKLAPDELMGDLIGDLDKLRFEELAGAGGPPGNAGLRGWVEVREGGDARTFVVPADQADGDTLTAFANMKLIVQYYYAKISGLQFIDNPAGADIFRRSP